MAPPDPAARRILLITVGAIVLLGGWMAQFGPEPSADDYAQYLMHARSLLDGRGFADTDYIFSLYAWGTGPPIAAPGLSLTLLPILATIGYADWLHPVTMLLAILALVGISSHYLGRWNAVHGAAAAYLTAVSLILVRGGSTLYPDIPFAVLCWIVIVLVDGKEEWGWSRTLAAAGFGVAALLYRTVGIVLVPAMLLFGAITWRSLRLKPLLVVAAWTATFWLVFVQLGAGQFPGAPVNLDAAGSDEVSLLHRALRNAGRYRWPLFDLQLYPFPWRSVNVGYHLVVTALGGWWLLRWIAGNWYRFGAIFFLGYVSLLLVAPVQSGRYLWPLFPFLAYGVVRALDEILKFGPLRRASVATRTMGPLLLLTAMSFVWVFQNPPTRSILQRDGVQALFQHFRDIEVEQPDVRVAFRKPRTLAWHAGVPTMALINPSSADRALSVLRDERITHVVLGTGELVGEEMLDDLWKELVAQHPEIFDLEYQNQDFEVFTLRPN